MSEDDVPVDPPVFVEDELHVSCSSCSAETSVVPDVDAIEEETDDGWQMLVTFDEDRLTIAEVFCPDHRLDSAIDDLVDAQDRLGRAVHESVQHAEAHLNDMRDVT